MYHLFMIKTLPITEARTKLPTLVDNANKLLDEYIITVNGKPAAVLMSVDELESLRETWEIMSDPEVMKDIRQGEKDFAEGKYEDWETVQKELNWDVQTKNNSSR